MFKTILRREFLDQLLSPKFLIVALLCLVLIPASLLLNYASYKDAYREYDANVREARDSTTVYREPSVLSTFAIGLETILPKSVVFTKYQSDPRGSQAQDEVLGNINGKIDFVVITSFLLGLFAVLYAGTMISGEKETGTLKLVLSNPARRSTVITAKFLGGFSVLLIPLAVSLLLGLLLLMLAGFPLFAAGNLGRILGVLALSVLYLAAMFSLGLLISTRTQRTSIALLASFFVWIFLTFVVPKTSEPIAGLFRPVKSEEAMRASRAQVRNQIEKEKGNALAPLMNKYLADSGQNKWDWAAYSKERGPIAKEYEDRLAETLQKFDAAYENDKVARRSLSLNIARLSPASVFTQASLDVCRTGIADLENFNLSLRAHYGQLYRTVFIYSWQDTFESEDGKSRRSMGGNSQPDGKKFDPPKFRYAFPRFEETLAATAPDVILLALFNLIFFAAAYFSFTRYDVR